MPLTEYQPGTAFSGVIGRTFDVSTPAWPRPLRARPGSPNVLFIILDDTGFGQLGCYGSPIRTPNLDRLAAGGLLYNNMHTTALCSPSRSCILTGRNHHSNAMSCITEGSTGYPGSNGYIPFENGFLSEILHEEGYNTYAIGKWHLTPADQVSRRRTVRPLAAGPWLRAVLRFSRRRHPPVLPGAGLRQPPRRARANAGTGLPPDHGSHQSRDRSSSRMPNRWHPTSRSFSISRPAPCTPRTTFRRSGPIATAACSTTAGTPIARRSSPARRSWASCRRTRSCPRHDPDVQAWESGSADERRLYARMMEVFAGFLEHTDHHIGLLLDFLQLLGELDNTLIMVLSDNGASAEGGPTAPSTRTCSSTSCPSRSRKTWRRSTSSAGRSTSTTTHGAGHGPAIRPSDAGSARPIAAGSAIRSSCTGPLASVPRGNPHAIRACDRHGADGARSARDHASDQPARRHAVAHRRGVVRADFRRSQRGLEAHHPVFRDAGASLDLSRRLARGVPVARHLVYRIRPPVRHPDPAPRR